MNRISIRIIVALLVALTLLAGGCGKKNEVGSNVTVKGGGKPGGGAFRDPNTTVAPSTTAAPTKVTTATTAKAVATTVAAEKPCTQVRNGSGAVQGYIAIGNANTPFDPRQAGFRTGAVVCWKNTDSVSHLVESANGTSFKSPPIAPGAIYRWVANVGPGKINYGDPDRPFAVGELVIQ